MVITLAEFVVSFVGMFVIWRLMLPKVLRQQAERQQPMYRSFRARYLAEFRARPVLTVFGVMFLLGGVMFALWQAFARHDFYFIMIFGIAAGLVVLFTLLSPVNASGSAALGNFRNDPTRCGACGMEFDPQRPAVQCNDCGWTVPPAEASLEPG